MKKGLIIFLVLFLLGFLSTGCNQADQAPPQQDEQQEPEQQVNKVEAIQDEWSKSGHAEAVNAEADDSPAKRDGCIICHDGKAYAKQVNSIEELESTEPTGQNCDSCHQDHGNEVRQQGYTMIPTGEIYDGQGALCLDCHHARKMPDPAEHPAPHGSSQADILAGTNGFESEGKIYLTSAHATLENTCLSCHMADLGGGYPSHTFKATAESCNKCHDGFDNMNPKARADFDGDGQPEGIQDEVEGLQEILRQTIEGKLNGGTFTSSHGQVVFQDAEGNELETVPSEEVYYAAWNYYLTANDGSRGIHNPVYVVELLQRSILDLEGDLKEAELR